MSNKIIRHCTISATWSRRPKVPIYVCSHVFGTTRPVLLVSRAYGDWQCLCGGYHGPSEVPRVVELDDLLEHDSSLKQVLDLPDDWEAERDGVSDPWIRTRGIADA